MLKSPTVLIVVDRIDLDTQITATFNATEIPNTIVVESREEPNDSLPRIPEIIITTIFKFAETEGVLNDRENIIVMVDEAHGPRKETSAGKCERLFPMPSSSDSLGPHQ